jgi:hypothetical protein
MKKHIVFICALIGYISFALSQNIVYSYDAAGNRILRKYVTATLTRSAIASPEQLDSTNVEAGIGEQKVTIYPNPTHGVIVVGISNYDPSLSTQFTLFTPDGKKIKTFSAQGERTSVEMSSYPSGWYLLRVDLGDNHMEFKIIKE